MDRVGGELDGLVARWVSAEQAGDTDALDELTVQDFVLVGPLGFVLDKEQWLDRYRNGDLITSKLTWQDAQTRRYGDSAIVVGVHEQEAAYRGQPNNGRFRVTHLWVRAANTWRLAGMHFSPITPPPGAAAPAQRASGST